MRLGNYMGVDYGEAKCGVAVSRAGLAEPLVVIRSESRGKLIGKLRRITEREKIEGVVVGLSEGEMAKWQRAFGLELAGELGVPVEFADETLTSRDAERFSIEAGIKRKKRRRMEDAYAAAIMLQGWLGSK
jgi:putative Holliday junction resolvase